MSRRVFFSFHFKKDAWRAGQIRNSNLLADDERYGFIDNAEWEKIEREGDVAIKRWIDGQLNKTSVTVILIGADTAERDWVDYEIRKSWERGNALVGVRIHRVKDQHGQEDIAGPNPLDKVKLKDGTPLSSLCKTYDWVSDDGRANLGKWVEDARKARDAYDGETALEGSENREAVHKATPRNPTVITSPARPWAR